MFQNSTICWYCVRGTKTVFGGVGGLGFRKRRQQGWAAANQSAARGVRCEVCLPLLSRRCLCCCCCCCPIPTPLPSLFILHLCTAAAAVTAAAYASKVPLLLLLLCASMGDDIALSSLGPEQHRTLAECRGACHNLPSWQAAAFVSSLHLPHQSGDIEQNPGPPLAPFAVPLAASAAGYSSLAPFSVHSSTPVAGSLPLTAPAPVFYRFRPSRRPRLPFCPRTLSQPLIFLRRSLQRLWPSLRPASVHQGRVLFFLGVSFRAPASLRFRPPQPWLLPSPRLLWSFFSSAPTPSASAFHTASAAPAATAQVQFIIV